MTHSILMRKDYSNYSARYGAASYVHESLKSRFSREGGDPVSGLYLRVPPRDFRGPNQHQGAACRGYRPRPLGLGHLYLT